MEETHTVRHKSGNGLDVSNCMITWLEYPNSIRKQWNEHLLSVYETTDDYVYC